MQLMGYRRKNGDIGIRNYLLIIPTSVCAGEVAERVGRAVEGAVVIRHQHGCAQMGHDTEQSRRTLIGFGQNPNVGAVLVIGLGCEGIQAAEVAGAIQDKPVESIVIQQVGGSVHATTLGIELAKKLADEIRDLPKSPFSIEELRLGLECGGSDPTSGIAANPTIGRASDLLVEAGGTSVLSETTEVIGAEHLLAPRFPEGEKRDRFLRMVADCERRAIQLGEDLRGAQPTPGNIAGGLTTIEEKSLGCMYKAGKRLPFQDALEYAQMIPRETPGLYFMDSPGQDIESISGMVAGGCQIVVFSTGRGSPTGCAIAPVIKLTGNPATALSMAENIDFNAGRIISEGASLDRMGEELYAMILRVANGEQTKAEINGHREFAIYRVGWTF